MRDLIEALGLDEVTLVGNDTGGAVCQLVVAEDPPRVARLVLTDCDAFEVFPPRGFGHLVWGPRIPGLPRLLLGLVRRSPRLQRSRFAYGALTLTPLDPALPQAWITPSATNRAIRRDLLKLLADARPATTLEVAERLRQFRGPTLLVWSRDDRFFPASLAHRLAAKLLRAEVVLVDGGGLLAPLDVPGPIADAIASFV